MHYGASTNRMSLKKQEDQACISKIPQSTGRTSPRQERSKTLSYPPVRPASRIAIASPQATWHLCECPSLDRGGFATGSSTSTLRDRVDPLGPEPPEPERETPESGFSTRLLHSEEFLASRRHARQCVSLGGRQTGRRYPEQCGCT